MDFRRVVGLFDEDAPLLVGELNTCLIRKASDGVLLDTS